MDAIEIEPNEKDYEEHLDELYGFIEIEGQKFYASRI